MHLKLVDCFPSFLTGFGQKFINLNQIFLLCVASEQKWPHSPESDYSQMTS